MKETIESFKRKKIILKAIVCIILKFAFTPNSNVIKKIWLIKLLFEQKQNNLKKILKNMNIL